MRRRGLSFFSGGIFSLGLLLSQESAGYRMEIDSLVTVSTFSAQIFTPVTFNQTFDTVPVVFALTTQQGGDPAILRINNVTRTGFDIVVVEPTGNDGRHVPQNIHYLAIEQGIHYLPTGVVLEVGKVGTLSTQFNSDSFGGIRSYDNVPLSAPFPSPPTVITQLQTFFNEQGNPPFDVALPWLSTVVNSISTNSFEMALERSDSGAGSVTTFQDVAYLAIERGVTGQFTAQGVNISYEALTTGNILSGWTQRYDTVNFTYPGGHTNPRAFASKSSRNDIDPNPANLDEQDGGWLRRRNLTPTSIELTVDEDRDNDNERSHTLLESASILVFGATGTGIDGDFSITIDDMNVSGHVFYDNGESSGTAHDGIVNGSEKGVGGLGITATRNSDGALVASAVTEANGAYSLDLPVFVAGEVIDLVVQTPASALSISEQPGSPALPGLVNPDNRDDALRFTPIFDQNYAGVNFGDVEQNLFSPNHTGVVTPGQNVEYHHTFTAQSLGDVSFSVVQQQVGPGVWTGTLYRDVNCDGSLSSAELASPIISAISVQANENICMAVRIASTNDVSPASTLTIDLTANFTYSNESPDGLTSAQQVQDVTQVITQSLTLDKSVENITQESGEGVANQAVSGDVLRYKVRYTNNGSQAVTNLNIYDSTPAFTTLSNPVSCGAILPPSLVSCSVVLPTAPDNVVGYSGNIHWSFTGALAASTTGEIVFDVQVE